MGSKKRQNAKAKDNKNKNLIFMILVLVLASFAVYSAVNNNQKQKISQADAEKPAVSETNNADTSENTDVPSNVDLKILKSEITDEAKFYPYKAGDTYMEVFAVKATDGSIRTALNTCQICFDSGQGYYKQSGNKVICQNCGNEFGVDDIEIVKGGCNPVPVMQENKTEDEQYITIDKEFLEANKTLFAEWKR